MNEFAGYAREVPMGWWGILRLLKRSGENTCGAPWPTIHSEERAAPRYRALLDGGVVIA